MPKCNAFLRRDDESNPYNLKKKQLRMNSAFDTNVVDTAYAVVTYKSMTGKETMSFTSFVSTSTTRIQLEHY